ncbi:hypothetical protein FEM41_11400 [Jejubacter calystegiae]|uniref:Uncharacterized protein n=1 Tax=Jejubacter calystegiae TaxID=2579935 RepID=A0A4P8YNM6_9ENTR|nr:hypothetical protein [Jejubacter calystegiae]QCT20212.1 hypothetical protein FEM41_11400 [Jejubacter calystegiae]
MLIRVIITLLFFISHSVFAGEYGFYFCAKATYSVNPNDGGELFQWYPRYDPDIVAEDKYTSCDSGGFYWVSKVHRRKISINRIADGDFTADNVGLVNRLVNGGTNGYYERQAYSKFIELYLLDGLNVSASVRVSPTRKSRVIVDLTKS